MPTFGPEDSPLRTVGLLTRAVTARARQAHSARALCGGIASMAVVLACVARRGGSVEDPEALILGALVGVLTFFAWRMSRRVATDAIARRVDATLNLRGAFVAAFEADRARSLSPIAQLGAARLALVLRRRDAMEAAIPHTMGFVALPLFALTGLALAVGARDAAERTAADAALQSLTLSANLASLARDGAAPLDELQRDLLEQAAQAAAAAATQSGRQQQSDMRDVAEELDALARDVPPGSDLARALSRAAAEAEAVALDVGGGEEATVASGDEGAAAEASESTAGMADTGPAAADPEADAAADPDSGSSDTGGATDAQAGVGAESPSDERAAAAVAPAGATSAPPEGPATASDGAVDRPSATVGEIRWWSDRDAGIVSRWMSRSEPRAGG